MEKKQWKVKQKHELEIIIPFYIHISPRGKSVRI
jgi:hypothetical protein